MRLSALVLGAWLLAAVASAADEFEQLKEYNWHQFRGPNADGVAPHGKPPVEWDEESGKNIKWKLEIPGDSTASPIVWQDQVFVLSSVKTDREGASDDKGRTYSQGEQQRIRSMRITPPKNFYQFKVMSIDRNTGKIRWEDQVREEVPHEGTHPDGSYAAASPITDGENLYVSFGSRGIYCFDLNGKRKWERDLGRMYVFSTFGESISPVLHGDTLVINWDHEEGSYITALDKKTGETKWKVDRDEKTGWTTPLVVDYQGRTQVITFNKNFIRSYDIRNGDIIWQCHGNFTACIPCPVANNELVYIMTGFQGYLLMAIPLDAQGDITGSDKIAWEAKQGTPYCPSPLLYGNTIYMTQENKGILSSLNAKTGDEVIGRQRLQGIGNIYASPVGADGRVYLTGRDGVSVVIKDAPKLEILATNTLQDRVDASAAIVDKQLFIRGRSKLYCIAE